MDFPRILLVDMNSFFASVEQQANPFLRGKPVGVVASLHDTSCLIATSKEAKKLGIKTGTLIYRAKKICPKIVLLRAEPEKYREVNRRIVKIFYDYTDRVEVYSIDEAFLELGFTSPNPSFQEGNRIPPLKGEVRRGNPLLIGAEIKKRIRQEVGEWLTCSVGIAPNKFMAKLAADMQKPDGLSIIWGRENLPEIYKYKKLRDLWGVSFGWEKRLSAIGITSPGQLLGYPVQNLISLFGKPGFYIWQRVNGLEEDIIPEYGSAVRIDERYASSVGVPPLKGEVRRGKKELVITSPNPSFQEGNHSPKSFGHSWVLNFRTTDKDRLKPVILRLAEKAARRMRKEGLMAHGFYLAIRLVDGSSISKQKKLKQSINTGLELYEQALLLLDCSQPIYRLKRVDESANYTGGLKLEPIRLPSQTKFGGQVGKRNTLDVPKTENRKTKRASIPYNDHHFHADVMHIAVGFRELVGYSRQLELDVKTLKRSNVQTTLDYLNDKYGEFTVRSGLLTHTADYAPDAIAFGK